jgi:hypothetical protein
MACALLAAVVQAGPADNIVLVPPSELPALARQGGEAMLLHDTMDGKTFLYVEQSQGTKLAVFDVTDPVHIKGEGSVQLDAYGPFDFVSPFGYRAELVRFREGHETAVLDLHRVKAPYLKRVQGMSMPGPIIPVGNEGYVEQVRGEVTKADTGTTFILTDNGLYAVRRLAVESIHQVMTVLPN